MEVRPVRPENALLPILVTLHIIPLGSVIVLGIDIIPLALAANNCVLVMGATIASVTLVVK